MTRTAIACFALWMICAAGGAGEQPPWLKEVNDGQPGPFPPLKPCRLEYVFSWSNIVRAGEAEITVGAARHDAFPGKLVGQSSGGSKGMARALWPYDHSFTSIVDPRSLRPVVFQSKESDRKETWWTTTTYGASGVSVRAVTQEKESGARVESARTFPISECHDLMSAFLYARSLPLKDGEEVVLLAHPFGSAYLGRLKVLGRERHAIGLGEFDAIKVDVDISKVQSDLQLKPYSRFKRATLWVSDDEYRVPLELRAEIFVGSIRVTLTERRALSPSGAAAAAPETAVPASPEEKVRQWFKGGSRGNGGSPFRKR